MKHIAQFFICMKNSTCSSSLLDLLLVLFLGFGGSCSRGGGARGWSHRGGGGGLLPGALDPLLQQAVVFLGELHTHRQLV